MSATQDYVALEWIRGELAKTLQNAQVALEAVSEAPDDASSMRGCLTAIHQVHGTLKMVQLAGPTQMAAEMEQVAQALMNSTAPDVQLAQETLMQAILQLPAYLDRLHREQEDSERNYLPIVNNLRLSRGEDRLPGSGDSLETQGTGPDLSPLTTPPTDDVVNTFFQADGEGNLPKIRARYQQSLGAILKKNDVRGNLTTLGKLLSMLLRLCGRSPMGSLAELGLGVVEGIANGGIRLDKQSAGLLKKIDSAIHALATSGQQGLSVPVNEALASGLIELIHGAQKDTKRIAALKAQYSFEAPKVVQEEISIGPDDETMSAVATILIEELRAVTDKLDIYVRAPQRVASDLESLLPNLEQISSTMVVLGNTEHQQTVGEQIAVIKAIDVNGEPDEEALLVMAQALLQVEASLSALVIDSEDGSGTDDFANLDEAQAAVVRETRIGLATGKDAVIEFITAEFDVEKILDLPQSLMALRGGLIIVNQSRAGDVLESAANYVSHSILSGGVQPELEQMDDLADAITSVDYYLERLLENAGDPYLQMLEVAETAVTKLGYPVGEPVPELAQADAEEPSADLELVEEPSAEIELIQEPSADLELVEEPSADLDLVEEHSADLELVEEPSADLDLVEEPSADLELVEEPSADLELIEEPSAELDLKEDASSELAIDTPAAEPAPEENDLIDDEILEIFVEEVEEVLENIGEFLPQWQSNLQDEEALTEIRRAFHTLKGSGRMVGATVVGELAWSVENMLNRIVDNTIEASPAVLDIVRRVVARVPEGIASFKQGNQHAFEPQSLADIADALAEGKEPLAELDLVEEPSAELELIEEPSAELELIEEPSAEFELIEEPLAELELIEEPSAELDLIEEPSAELDLIEEPSAELELEEEPIEIEELPLELIEEEDDEAVVLELEDFEDTTEDVVDSFELEDLLEEDDAVEDITFESIDTLDDIEVAPTFEADTTFGSDADEEIEFEFVEPLSTSEAEPVVETDDTIEEPDVVSETEEVSFESTTLEAGVEDPENLVEDNIFELDELEAEVEDIEFDFSVDGSDESSVETIHETEETTSEDLTEADEFLIDGVEEVDAHLDAIAALEEAVDSSPAADVLVEELPIIAASAEDLLESDDLELDDIFTIEANEKLDVIDAFVSADGELSGDVVAAFHTLKGSSAMAEITAITRVAAPLEKLSNDYLIQNKPADDHLKVLAAEATSLMRLVLSDLENYRNEVPGESELLARVSVGPIVEVQEVGFDFQEIILLSEANVAADGWQDVDALIAEIQNADEQAQVLNQPALSALLLSMARIYRDSPGRPDELTLSLMRRAHDHLVFMFDALASSQPLRPADRVIAELDAVEIDVSAVVEEPSADLVEEPSADLVEEPSADLVEEPSADLVEEPSADLVEEPSADLVEEPSADLVEEPAVVELPADAIDEDILPIFLEESEELLEELDQSILGWSESGEPGEHLDNLLRQLHTIKGGARMAGVSSLGEYAHNFETFLIGVQSKPVPFDPAFFAILHAQQDELTRRVEIYQNVAQGNASQQDLDSLKTASVPGAPAQVVKPVAPEPEKLPDPVTQPVSAGADTVVDLPEDNVDEDILPIFLEESDDLVEELETSIQSWSESPGNLETLDLLLRNLHTLKGGARMAGLNSLGEYAHNFETFLIEIQRNPVDLNDDFFALLNKRQDEVIRRVEIYKKLSFGAATSEDLDSLKQALEPTLETEPVEAPEAAADPEEASEPAAASTDKTAASANQEMVRVSADLLEELIGLAGESSITRGRIEQQITDFGDSLQEMEETINRIRDQVRRLEIEAESRETLIRSRSGPEKDSSFDELEMDRYTMLQAISRALNEGSSDMMDLKDTLANRSRDAETLLHQQARISGELQEGLTRTRMVPFARLIPRLRRIVRQISTEVGKSVRFDAYNVEGELDRNVLERIVAPLEHMLRNAVDHGIEDTSDRLAAGKNEQGRISLRLSREGGYVVLTISDDGGGINVDAVRNKAAERGLITATQEVSDHEVMQFIMHAGFSTAQKLTQISGRGVGMDVVGSEIKALGGSISIDSTLGVGSEFTIRIPFTVSINRALMVVVKEETYAVPLNTIEGIVRVSPYELEAYYQPDAPMFEYAGQPYRLAYIGNMLDRSAEPNLAGQVAPLPVILARSGENAVALQVDKVIGSREVVVKTLGPQFGDVGGISGATVLGDGSVVIILDCMALVRSYESAAEVSEAPLMEEPVAEPDNTARKVMIVDDSVTVRKVTTRLMERQGYEVTTAKDGIDALNQLQDIRPDVMLLDIEMPRMDGFEVLRSVRRDEAIKDLPIIMITSRTGEKHKQQAMELGVNQYLGKPFQEANLLATIEEVISSARNRSKQD